jgi:methionyl-tRNA synthetase
MPETHYITTPIYYVNDRPHIGHVFTTTLADVYARYQRARGSDVFFLTGTDEHATKVVEAAQQRGLSPQAWADQNAAAFQQTFTDLQLSFDDFIRTSQERHTSRVVRYFSALRDSGDVYLGQYEGWYDANQEEYIPDNKARELDYKSPITGKPLVRKTEQNYFFRLSAYRQQVLDYFKEHPDFVKPEARRNEIVNRIAEAEDVPISRTGMGEWGIRVPGDESHTIYVWIDALFNYLTAVDTDDRRHFWKSAPIHALAKDILWFHAAIWPAMLMALRKCKGYEWIGLPKLIYSHSFWISEGQKMSKSLGNFIDLEAISHYVTTYGLDALRWYLVTQGPLGAQDSNFSAAHFHKMYADDLVNTVGNCASRVTAMIGKYFDGVVPEVGSQRSDVRGQSGGIDLPAAAVEAVRRVDAAMKAFDLAAAASEGIGLLRKVDAFINATEPFKVAKDPSRKDELAMILYQCIESVRIASLLLSPVLIARMPELWSALGVAAPSRDAPLGEMTRWGGLKPGTKVQKVALYPRIESAPAAIAQA